ncbi:MAG: hypothetical protein WC356_04170 [Candidatus Micrarchaeia archaeon]|jgi:hypothetical protein
MENKKSPEEIIEQTIKDGGLMAEIYFDLHGSSPEIVKNIMTETISKLTQEPGIIFAYGEIDDAIKCENNLYSTYSQGRVLAKDLESFLNLCMKYAPMGVEVIKPHKMNVDAGTLQRLFLNAASFSYNFTEMYLEKALNEEDKIEYAKKMKAREEMGKKILERITEE